MAKKTTSKKTATKKPTPIICLKVFKPTQRMNCYQILALTMTGDVVTDASIFFQDMRSSKQTIEELFYSWTKSLSPRVKNPLKSKKFSITLAGADEHRINERNAFYNKYVKFINKESK